MNTAPQTDEQKEKIAKFGRNLAIHVGGFHPTAIGAIPGAVETVVEEEYKVWGVIYLYSFIHMLIYYNLFLFYFGLTLVPFFLSFVIIRMLRFWERLSPKI